MADIGAGAGTGYPVALDVQTVPEVDLPAAGATNVRAATPNDLAAAIIAVETELGIAPSGSVADLAARIAVELNADGTAKAKGTAADLTARLTVVMNDDGTLKQSALNWNLEHNADGTHQASAATPVDFKAGGDVPTFVSAGVFTVPGDRTLTYTKGRRLEINGPVYSTVQSAVFTTLTTITVEEGNIPAGITSVSFGITSTGTTGSAPKDQQVTTNFNAIEDLAHRLSLLEAATNPGLNPQDFFADTTQTDLTATTMDLANNSGQKDIQVASTVGFAVGDSIDLLHATDPTLSETVAITSITAGDKLRSVTTLVNSYPIGSFVKRSGTVIVNGKLRLLNNVGDGRDGLINITTGITKTIDNEAVGSLRTGGIADAIERVVTVNPSGTSISVAAGDEAGFAAGDKVLLINKRGGAGDIADVGNYETFIVLSTSSGILNIDTPIVKSYDGASFATQKISVQRIPQYSSVTLNHASAVLTCNTWNGAKGGVLNFVCTGSVTVTLGSINADGKGYRGGIGITEANWGTQGESRIGLGAKSRNASDNGGGGGKHVAGDDNGGGGGGGHATAGVNGTWSTTSKFEGFGGGVVGDVNLVQLLFGGGGGGFSQDSGDTAEQGGPGGGIVTFIAETIALVSNISCKGANGSGTGPSQSGSGAGGSIFLRCRTLTGGTDDINATFGHIVDVFGDGGSGRIRPGYTTINAAAFPDITQEQLISLPDAGSTFLYTFIPSHKAARYRSIIVSRPQRMVSKIILFVRQNLSVFHTGITSNIGQDRFSGISPVGDASLKYAIGDTVVFRDSAGFYVKKLDGNVFVGTVSAVDGVAGTIDVAEGIPSAESGARLERCDIKPRASIVATGAAEAMVAMDLKVVEQEPGSIELLYEWHQIPAVNGQDSNVELALSTTDPAQQGNVYAVDYTSLLQFL